MAIISKTFEPIEYLVAEGITAPHCFTTRLGGVSAGALESLNLGTARGDDPANMVENYRRIGGVLGFAPPDVVMARQTHSDIVLQVDASHRGAGLTAPPLPECDALITNEPGIALFVSTADCTPILLHDPVTGAIGATHAGWRGTAAKIGAKTVAAMVSAFGCNPKDICAAIGPNIGFCHFETDADVPRAMVASYGESIGAYIVKRGQKFYLDLKSINAVSLREAGVMQIEISDACTVCQCHRFWSHRVTRGNRGAQGAIILKEGSL